MLLMNPLMLIGRLIHNIPYLKPKWGTLCCQYPKVMLPNAASMCRVKIKMLVNKDGESVRECATTRHRGF